jgi:predicted TIM-barrel fold metal-dependent hydrolase
MAGLPFAEIPIVDHHAHSLLLAQPTTPEAFRRLFTESPDPVVASRDVPHTLFYRRALRDLAEILGCEATEEAVVAARNRMALEDLVRYLFTDARIEAVLVDYGYRQSDHYSHRGLGDLLPCRVEPVLRLETLAEELLARTSSLSALKEAFVAAVDEAPRQGVVAYKTIIAYRCGLAVQQHPREAVEAAYRAEKARVDAGGRRIAAKPLLDTLLWLALERIARHHLPVQVHTGFGDTDLHLVYANPAWLRPVLEHFSFGSVTFVLLHCWPFVREAAWLAGVYAHVYLDLSLTVPFVGHGGAQAFMQALEHAPLTKVLYASDAFSIPELFWLAARHGRLALATALEQIRQAGYVQPGDVAEAAEAILHRNARTVYRL